MSSRDIDLTRRWVAARVRLTLRNPRVVVFTFVFPLVLLVLFGALQGNQLVDAANGAGGKVHFAQFYTPSIGIFGLTMACYSGMVLQLATARDSGLLKRVRGTPLPMAIYLGAWLAAAVLTGVAAVALMFVVAVPAFGVDLYAHTLPAAVVTLVLGAVCLASVGLAVATLVRTADQAMPVAQLTFLPLSFISGIFYPVAGAPAWVIHLAELFPLYHLVQAFDACFQPQTTGSGFAWNHLLVLVIWTALGLRVAVARFRSEPGRGERRGWALRAR
jgi:ABC-2 type transport system permease protein